MIKSYEYKRTWIVDNVLNEDLRKFNLDGWELVTATIDPNNNLSLSWICIFKREVNGT